MNLIKLFFLIYVIVVGLIYALTKRSGIPKLVPGDIFIAKLTRKIGSRNALFWWLLGSFVMASFYLPFAGPITDFPIFIFALVLNIVSFAGVLFYFEALEIGNASLVGTIGGAFPVITVPLSILLFKEQLTWFQFAAIILTFSGLILATLRFEELKNRNFRRLISDRSIKLALAAFVIWGVFWAVIRIPVEKIGWFWSNYPIYLSFILLPLFNLVRNIPLSDLKNKKTFLITILGCILTLFANFGFNLGLTYGYTSIVAPIAGASPVLFVIISRFVFREKLTSQQKLGIVFALAGIVLISISSV